MAQPSDAPAQPSCGIDPSGPGTVEVEFPDGTRARWATADEGHLDQVAAAIEAVLGAPDTLAC